MNEFERIERLEELNAELKSLKEERALLESQIAEIGMAIEDCENSIERLSDCRYDAIDDPRAE